MVVACGSARQGSEVELKLEFVPSRAADLVAHPALASTMAPAEERNLVSTYFDTPDCALHKAGVYLRVREDGGRFLQTIKTAKSKTEVLERYEWERDIPSRTPDLAAAKGTALEPLLTPETRAALKPIFETRIKRRTHLLARGGTKIEAAIDRGEVSTNTQTCPICELELELEAGDRRELFRLAREIAAEIPLRLEVKTKAERGFELHTGRRLEAEKAASVVLPPDMAAGEAFRAVALNCLRQIVANEPAVCAGRSEALHQMRIGIRRLRAAMTIFADLVRGKEKNAIKTELKWIMQELGPARELDVFTAEVLAPAREKRPEDSVLATAESNFEKKRKAAYAGATGAVGSARYRSAILDLVEWIECGAWTEDDAEDRKALRARALAQLARKRLAKLCKNIKRKGADLRRLAVAERHRLRVAAKRLRYATEFFSGTFPGEAAVKRRADFLKALKDLQDALGGLNDLAAHRALIADHLNGAAQDAAALKLVADEPQAEALLRKAEQAFQRFAAAKPFWKV
jgi:triphosphatase